MNPTRKKSHRRYSKGAFSAPQRAWDGTTQQSKRSNRCQGKTTKKQQSKWYFLFLLRRGHPSLSLSQGKMMVHDAVARAPSQCLSTCVMERHNNQKFVAMAHFSFSSLNQNQNLFHSNMSPLPAFLNDACPAVSSPTIFLNDASSSDEEEEQHNLTAANMKKSDPPKRKAAPPGKTSKKKKKKHCDISNADLNAQLKQVSPKNANDSLLRADDSLLHAATEDNETK